jgi:hypothetical protein
MRIYKNYWKCVYSQSLHGVSHACCKLLAATVRRYQHFVALRPCSRYSYQLCATKNQLVQYTVQAALCTSSSIRAVLSTAPALLER